MSFAFGTRSLGKLLGVHPDLVRVMQRALDLSPVDFAISDGVRTKDRQLELFDAGKSKTLNSKHLRQADGYGHAVDVMAVGDLDRDGDFDHNDIVVTWDPRLYQQIAWCVARAAGELGVTVRWGGSWSSFPDGPHFELS